MVSSRFSSNVNPYSFHKVLGRLSLPPPLIFLYPTGNAGFCKPAINYILFIYHTCFYLNIFELDNSSAFIFPVCFSKRILQNFSKCANNCIQTHEHTQTHSHRHKHNAYSCIHTNSHLIYTIKTCTFTSAHKKSIQRYRYKFTHIYTHMYTNT